MIYHPHLDDFFDAEFADLDSVEAHIPMLTHLLALYPCLTGRVQAHDQFEAAHLLMTPKGTVAELFRTPTVTIIDAL